MGVTIRKKDGKWYVFVIHDGERKAKCIGQSRAAALQVKRVLEAKLALGDLGFMAEPNGNTPTFKEYIERWQKEYADIHCKPSTRRSYEQLLRVHVTPVFGQTKLTAITRQQIKEFVSNKSRESTVLDEKGSATAPRYSRNTLRLIVSSLRSALSSAVEDGILESNPASRVGKFAKTEKPDKHASAMTRAEAELFLSAVQEICPPWFPFFLTALRAGLRKGELIALKWGDIQFGKDEADSNRFILVQRNWACNEFTTPKSKKSRRVDMSRELRRVLLALRDRRVIEALAEGRKSIADDLVFPSKKGTPMKPDNIAVRYMQPALEKADLRRFRFHDLRHSFGSLLIQDGASLAYVRDQLGHASIQVTVDVYGHLVAGADISWVDRLDSETTPRQNATPAQPEGDETEGEAAEAIDSNWLPPRDSNPDMLIQSQLSYH